MARVGGGIDLEKFRVVGADFLPASPSEPVALTPNDYAALLEAALKAVGVKRLFAIVGASFGAMIGQALCERSPDFVSRQVVLCAAHKPAAMATAWRLVQRKTIALAMEAGCPQEGVRLARQLAMTTYRTAEEFNARFDGEADVDAYLENRGADYANRMSAARYLTLSAAIDRHQGRPEKISTPTLVIAADSDRLAPLGDVADFQSRLGGASRLEIVTSKYGHDAFLKETATIAPLISKFLLEA